MRKGCFVRYQEWQSFFNKVTDTLSPPVKHTLNARSISSLAGSTQSWTRLLCHWIATERRLLNFLVSYLFTHLQEDHVKGLTLGKQDCFPHRTYVTSIYSPFLEGGLQKSRGSWILWFKKKQVRHNIRKGLKTDRDLTPHDMGTGGKGRKDKNLSVSW